MEFDSPQSDSKSHLTLYEHVKEDIVALWLLGVCVTVLGRRVGAAGRGWVDKSGVGYNLMGNLS